MDLKGISSEINDLLEKKRQELQLRFVEEDHIYFMKDLDGKIKTDFPSVSKILKKFHKPFDAQKKAHEMTKGDPDGARELLEQWKQAGILSTNMGSRVHFELEKELVGRYGNYKEVRQPIFNINEEQQIKSDNMIIAGKNFLDLMGEREAVLLDTEIVLGCPEEQYVGQPDKCWLMMNKDKTDFGVVITDWKSNQPKNFEVQYYTGKMYSPFEDIHDNALGHYYLQLPLYARLLLKMLKGTKYENVKFMGGVIVLLKDDGTFVEYKVPRNVNEKILTLDLKKYIKR